MEAPHTCHGGGDGRDDGMGRCRHAIEWPDADRQLSVVRHPPERRRLGHLLYLHVMRQELGFRRVFVVRIALPRQARRHRMDVPEL